MRILDSIQGARSLTATAKRLGLNRADQVKYAASWYLSRTKAFASMAPPHFQLTLQGGFRALVRPNGVDRNTLADIFGTGLYAIDSHGIQRVLDLGANVGIGTLFFYSRFPDAEFACVEPFPGNLEVLEETIRRNGIRAKVFKGVVGPAAAEVQLAVDCPPDMYSLVPGQTGGATISVRQFSAPQIMSAMGWTTVDLVKIDIEGYEKILFRENAGWLRSVRLIVGEAHGHVGYGIEQVRADLAPLGFEVTMKSFDERSVNGLTVFEARNTMIGAGV